MWLLNRLAMMSLLFAGASGAATLTVDYAGKPQPPVTLPDGARLEQFYAQTNFPDDVNWSAALIASTATTQQAMAQGQSLQDALYRLQVAWQNSGDGDYATAAWYIAQALKTIPVTGRIPARIDPDWVRLHVRDNRPLVGDYTLYLTPYRPQLLLFGLLHLDIDIGTPNVFKVMDLQPGWTADQYVDGLRFLPGADKDYGYLISAGGWRRVPLAVWNRRHLEPAAGETLFVGFNPAILPEEMKSLNEQIADYLANRIPH